jgi:hypothetical protein
MGFYDWKSFILKDGQQAPPTVPLYKTELVQGNSSYNRNKSIQIQKAILRTKQPSKALNKLI